APFEFSGSLDFDVASGGTVDFAYASNSAPACHVSLSENLTWADFASRCGDTRTLNRVNYVTETARDASDVEFNGITFGFLRPDTLTPLRDGQPPDATDHLYYVQWTRSLDAAVDEFRPLSIANDYATRLTQRLNDSL